MQYNWLCYATWKIKIPWQLIFSHAPSCTISSHQFKYYLNGEKWLAGSTVACFREWKRAHGCEKIARVGRGMKEGAVLKKLFRKNPNREYGKKEWRQSVEARSCWVCCLLVKALRNACGIPAGTGSHSYCSQSKVSHILLVVPNLHIL